MRLKVRGPEAETSEPDEGVGLAGSSGTAAVGDDAAHTVELASPGRVDMWVEGREHVVAHAGPRRPHAD